jgi:hypothetical protein
MCLMINWFGVDVSRYAGHYEHVFETKVAGVTLQAPLLDIHTVSSWICLCCVEING